MMARSVASLCRISTWCCQLASENEFVLRSRMYAIPPTLSRLPVLLRWSASETGSTTWPRSNSSFIARKMALCE